ncbi:MAG TPA: TonB-dependent receptor [Rhodanobacteraceae bacterium]|jgi:iron complex outermembrane receptor protein|nr:TonB-dependent receptor [Rhodanobacteraceae bacterium]
MNTKLSALAAAVVAALAMSAVHAQTIGDTDAPTATRQGTVQSSQPQPKTEAQGQPQTLGTIVVTSTKRAQLMQDVPAAINVVTAKDVQTAGLTTAADLQMLVPGITMVPITGPATSNVVIRGLSTTIGEPNVGFFVDGVYIPDRSAANFLLADNIARVEVALGPQYALYGQNTFGGAVNFITKRPGNKQEGSVSAGIGSHGSNNENVVLSGPVSDGSMFHYRTGAARHEFGGFYRNDLTGDDLDGTKAYNGFLTLDGVFGDRLDAQFNLIYDGERRRNYAEQFVSNNGDFSPAFNDYQTYVGNLPSLTSGFGVTPGRIDRDSLMSSLNLNYAMDWATLTSVTSYNHLEIDQYYDSDYTAAPVQMAGTRGPQSSVSEDLRLTSPGNDRFEWLFGFYYYHFTNHHVDSTNWVGPAAPLGGLVSDNQERTRSAAVYGSATWHITPKWDFEFVMRYTRETKSISVETTALPNATTVPFDDSRTFTPFTPGVYLTWKPSSDVRVYASAIKAIKVGGFNTFTTSGAIAPDERSYSPERTMNYELGTKIAMLDGRMFLDMDVYRINWSDMIVRTIGSQGALLNTNAGRSHSEGAEANLQFDPNRNWSFRAGAAYNHAVYDEYIFPILGLVGLNPDLAGTQLQYAPRLSASLSVLYTTQLGNAWTWTTRLDGRYRSSMVAVQYATALVPGVTLFNLHTSFENGPWRVGVWVDNLFNRKEAPGAVFTSDPATTFEFATGQRPGMQLFQGLVNAPVLRTCGVDVRYSF